MQISRKVLVPVTIVLALSCNARGEEEDQEYRLDADNVTWRAECGSCHLAYPPALLRASAWRQIMNRLDRHYGSDATLEGAQVSEIRAFLEKNAGLKAAGISTDLPRITLSPWFKREHKEVSTGVWHSSAVRSASNCAACHRQAASGDFGERSLQLPR